MKKVFNYKIERAEDISDKLGEYNNELREIFKEKIFKLNYETTSKLRECFASPSMSIKDSDECVVKAREKLEKYYIDVESIYNTNWLTLRSCVEKCDREDSNRLSTCFNTSASKIFTELQDYHKSIN